MSFKLKLINNWVRKFPILVFCFILSIALLILLYFRLNIISLRKTELNDALSKVSLYQANIANSMQIDEQLEFLVKANESVRKRCLKPDGLAENLQYFYRLESETGVKYIDLRPASRSTVDVGKKSAKSTYLALGYIINVQGTFPQVLSFLKHLENGFYFSNITNVSVSSSGTIVNMSLTCNMLGSL